MDSPRVTATWIGAAAHDARHAWRALRRSPGFAAVAVLTLALGIGANTAIFSVINAVLLEPLPYDKANRLVLVQQSAPGVGEASVTVSLPEFYDYREQLTRVDDLVEFHEMSFDLLRRGDPDRVSAGVVSPRFFDVLGIRPLHGRSLIDADDGPDADAVLVLGHAYWQSRFGGDPAVVGEVLEMNDRPYTVVGILPPVPLFPHEVDVYMPTSACPFRAAAARQVAGNRRIFSMLQVFGRLAPGETPETAAAEVAVVGRRFAAAHADVYRPELGFQARAAGVREALTTDARPVLLVLLGTTGLVLLIACANVASLTVARTIRRDGELAVRATLGAGRWRLARHLLTESTLLAVAGGTVGLALAVATRTLLVRFVATFTPRASDVAIDGRVLLFTMAASILAGVLFGLIPAVGGRRDLSGSLRQVARGAHGAASRGRRLQHGLVVVQVAASAALLAGAGLLLASLIRLQHVDPGYRGEGVMSAEVFGNFSKYPTNESLNRFYDNVLERLEHAPGVLSAAVTNAIPLAGAQPGETRVDIEGQTAGMPDLSPTADVRVASPAYFSTLGIPLLRGRLFAARDDDEAGRVVVVNRAVTRYWEERDPIGSRISLDGGDTWSTVVGVVGDVRQFGLDRDAVAQVYVPLAQTGDHVMGRVLVRTSDDAASAVPIIRAAVRGVDADMPIENVRTLDELRAEHLATPRLITALVSIFAALAFVVAIMGIAGVVATSVSQRTREFGVRIALGATAGGVRTMVLREGLLLVAAGLAVGLALAFVLGRVLQVYLFETPPADPVAFVAVAAASLIAGAAACLGPAWRATSVDPVTALRGH